VPVDGKAPPRILHVSGLEGVGRRTVVAQVSQNVLHMSRILLVPAEEGDNSQDLAIKIADLTGAYPTNEAFKAMADKITALPDDEATARSAENLKVACSTGEMPVLLDMGGILDQSGNFKSYISDLLGLANANGETYVTLITHRRLASDDLRGVGVVPSVGVPPMKFDEVKRLLSVLAKSERLSISPPKTAQLAERVQGWPPAAYFCIQFIKQYGLDALLADNLRIAEVSLALFRKYLHSIAFDEFETKLLRTLATHSPLPLAVLAEVVKLNAIDTTTRVCRVIDFSLVLVNEDGTYSASPPLREAILREMGYFNTSEHGQVASVLDDYLSHMEEGLPRLDLARVLFRAFTLSGTTRASERALALASDWVRMTRDAYHARDYERAATLGKEAVTLRPESGEARSYLIRAQVQLERWDEAEAGIAVLRQQKDLREAYFLTGFLARRRGRFAEAIKAFRKSVDLGGGRVAVYRELAFCQFKLGSLQEALETIRLAESIRENRYVADLKVKIETELGDEHAAREGLARLEILETPMFFNHRLSDVEATFGNFEKAYQASIRAWASEPRPPFEVLAQLVFCEIATNRFDAALEHLAILDKRFHYTRLDIRTGLRCRLEIARGEIKDALVLWEKIQEKSLPVHQALRRDILLALLRDNPSGPLRKQYEAELRALREVLADTHPSFDLE
jgi:tetratricopeptide (TPR) repeat protein